MGATFISFVVAFDGALCALRVTCRQVLVLLLSPIAARLHCCCGTHAPLLPTDLYAKTTESADSRWVQRDEGVSKCMVWYVR